MTSMLARGRFAPAPLLRSRTVDAGIQEEASVESAELSRVGLDEIWRRLVTGQLSVVEARSTEDHVWIVVEEHEAPRPSRPAEITVLERVFRGEPQKIVAMDLGVSVATITRMCMAVLERIGVQTASVANAPVLLVMAAHAASGVPLRSARAQTLVEGGRSRWRIVAENPALALRGLLSPSEYAVACLAVRGESDVDIARLRSTSPRTIANQVASAFRKVRVARRSELRAAAVLATSRHAGAVEPTALWH